MAKALRRKHSALVAAIGTAFSVGIAAAIVLLPREMAIDILTAITGCFSGVYYGFAFAASSSARNTAVNFAVATLFLACALAGAWLSPMFFALACFAHAAWDIVVTHPKAMNEPVAAWYAPICVSADIVLGVFVVFWFW